MKKILMGLIAVTSLSFAAQPVINGTQGDANTGDGKNVWETGQSGSINLTVKLISEVPAVRYVVYASADGAWGAGASDEWSLPTMYVTKKASTNVFSTDTPMTNIYVKRVNSNKDNVEALQNEKVTFTLGIDPLYTQVVSEIRNTTEGVAWVTSVLPKTELEKLATAVGGTVNVPFGVIMASNNTVIRTPNYFRFYSDAEGVLKVETVPDDVFATDSPNVPAGEYDKFFAWFATEKTNTMPVKVTID